jgi:hypothetical protein
MGFALANGEPVLAAIRAASLGLEALTALAWACLFLALDALSRKHQIAGSAPQTLIVFFSALITGILHFYRTDPVPARLLFSCQYALLVVLALWLFGFLASWLSSPRGDPQSSRPAA